MLRCGVIVGTYYYYYYSRAGVSFVSFVQKSTPIVSRYGIIYIYYHALVWHG